MQKAGSHIRQTAVAGSFYEDNPKRCAADARRLCEPFDEVELPAVPHGALVPHAGWTYSGRTAGGTLAALAAHTSARTLVITGSVHTVGLGHPATDTYDAWMTPLGPVAVDGALREAINGLDDFRPVMDAHRVEHCIEVELPLIQTVFGEGVMIVPCLIPPQKSAPQWGRQIGRLLREWPEPVAVIASVDLTHYGPSYGFTSHGAGESGYRWAHETNDRQLLNLISRLAADDILAHTDSHHSACGGGAIAATAAACAETGARRGYVLHQTDSTRETGVLGTGNRQDSVGYAGVVFG
ncbi:MAG: AmmeMemoRadiSam system protein B [Phycisphaerales bacterium]|nr:MAG: AmmeMemoRadiSam system protein B [Phycisphaerales bacterium]